MAYALMGIPAERMKKRNRHIVPLARQTLEVLGVLHDLTGHSKWLFPGDRNPEKFMSNNTILKALERTGYKGAMIQRSQKAICRPLKSHR
jgi:integrase